MHPIIAMWSHPRSVSTATERIMRERDAFAALVAERSQFADNLDHHRPFHLRFGEIARRG
ncbi:hypothetical protein ACQ5SP_01765 [Rhodovulum sp. YNF3179]|uniref:hypothetical protein n=1 Tax=Rhodovulum sp. YNF3179 TaxID=3425127 RepID=UPI003D326017